MLRTLKSLAMVAAALAAPALGPQAMGGTMSLYDFSFTAIDGEPLAMERFRGRPVLLVNTASFCGFTGQYAGLQTLWEAYGDVGLVVLGVPSNDFGNQEPGSEAEIRTFCETNYNVTFPMTEKQAVIGPDAHPLYRWIGAELGEDRLPRWNFHKYLFDAEGNLAGAWPSRVKPDAPEIRRAVEASFAAG